MAGQTKGKRKSVDNVSGLQLFHLMRFGSFLIISIVLTKSTLTAEQIGQWEMFLFIASLLSFFWVTGLIQSFLPLYNRNRTYRRLGDNNMHTDFTRSPEIFNTFILLMGFSLLFFVTGHLIKGQITLYGYSGNVPYFNLLLLYLLLSNPTSLIEYIYLVRNKSAKIIHYGLLTFGAQLVLVLAPVLMGRDLLWSYYGLIIISLVRWVWLMILLTRYAEWTFSWTFIREHLHIGAPLIITSLISGSAQYIDGLIVTGYHQDPKAFAIFRYGAKEFPLVLMLANGLSNAMLPEFSNKAKIKSSLATLRRKSAKLMHYLFPASLLMLFIARWLYPVMFNESFGRSADVFMIYLLLVIPRLVFPQTILIGMRKTQVTLVASVFELALNIPLSLWLVQDYGVVGVALATFIVFTLEKIGLVIYNSLKLKIRPKEYIPLAWLFFYTSMTVILFVLIDHRIIDIR